MNLSKLQGVIAESRIKKKDIAKALGISPQAFSAKLGGRSNITNDDAIILCDILNIVDDCTKCEIFLT